MSEQRVDVDEMVEIPTRVLVESMIRDDATIDASELYMVAGALGMSDQQVRLQIKRLANEGLIIQEGRGRRALLRVGGELVDSIGPNVEFVRFMYDQDRGAAPWNGVWHLVGFAVPEARRHDRDAVRDGIVSLGGAAVQGGLYVSPNSWEPYIDTLASRLDIAGYLTRLTTTDLRVGNLESPRDIAAQLWPLDKIAAGHQRLRTVAQTRLDRLTDPHELSPSEMLTVLVELAAEFTRASEPDPLLPPELLPQPWPGTQARAVLAACWTQLMHRETLLHAWPRMFHSYADVIRQVSAVGDSPD
ncbi:PaaX family transcriptional regulator C-terminal domain-containing protein [Nocardia fluminea]|uniref:PaaX family transcriptional regulator C-terminal domain-containing protein n=1 Tax=Nocardia fluminea TaxID=134984 RepID=UPI003D100396